MKPIATSQPLVTIPFALLALFVVALPAFGAGFAGGTGEPNDPYQIATAEQLLAIGSDPTLADRHFVLVADIDMATDPSLAGGRILNAPICDSFAGTFDGASHQITGFQIQAHGQFVGLFGTIEAQAVVKDLTMKAVQISDGTYTGSMAGINHGRIISCSSLEVTVAGDYAPGGLVSQNYGLIDRACVTGVAGTRRLGAIMAHSNYGFILRSHAESRVPFVLTNDGAIAMCDANGPATWGAGLVYGNSGVITRCYTTNPTGNSIQQCYNGPVGPVVGHNGGTMSLSYATDSDGGRPCLGGSVVAGNSGTVVNCFGDFPVDGIWEGIAAWWTNSAYFIDGYQLQPADANILLGCGSAVRVTLTDAQMRQQSSFIGWDFVDTDDDGTDDIWAMPKDGGYPVLAAFLPEYQVAFAGKGSTEDPYLIGSKKELLAMAQAPTACFRLTQDIDLQGMTSIGALIPAFTGNLDGAGHTIKNFNLTGTDHLGLFGILGPFAQVQDLEVKAVHIRCPKGRNIGLLAGRNQGTLIRCSAVGDITIESAKSESKYLGGLIGLNDGAIWQCSAHALVTAIRESSTEKGPITGLGGLVGQNSGSVTDCFSTGYVCTQWMECSDPVICFASGLGGLVGTNAGTISNSYAAASVRNCKAAPPSCDPRDPDCTRTQPTGGLVGANAKGATINGSYFLAQEDGGGPDNGLGIQLTDTQMRQQTSFVGWDFVAETANGVEDIWQMPLQGGYPILTGL